MGFDGWWWWPNPFGPASPESAWITWTILGALAVGLIGAVPAAIMRTRIKNMFIDRRLRNPKYVELNKGKFFHIDQNSNLIILRSGVYPSQNTEWVMENNIITINPNQKDKVVATVSFSEIARVEIQEVQHHGKFGMFCRLRVWRNDVVNSLIPENHGPSHSIAFKSIGLEAAEEIVRRYNEYAASQKNK